jgi:hypothetical protein
MKMIQLLEAYALLCNACTYAEVRIQKSEVSSCYFVDRLFLTSDFWIIGPKAPIFAACSSYPRSSALICGEFLV